MRTFFVLLLAATLALARTAGVAQAKGKAGRAQPIQKKTPTVAYVFEGTVHSVDEVDGTGTVTVNATEANEFANAYLQNQGGTTQVMVKVDTEGEDAASGSGTR